jgi:hypothetical protein
LLDSQKLFLDFLNIHLLTSITFAPDDFKKQSSVAHLLGCTCSFLHLRYFSLTSTKALEEKAFTDMHHTIKQKQRSRSALNFQLSDKLGIANPTALLGLENLI